jgi:small subunit ribosomal protein S16
MPVKIRLARHGKKKSAFFHIVAADSRAPRDGRFIEKIGTYNPGTEPPKVSLNADKALTWLQKGAQPTDTTRTILSEQGVMFRYHLSKGVKKGAFSQEQADKKFGDWIAKKEAEVSGRKDKTAAKKAEEAKARLAAEAKVSEARAKAAEEKKTSAEKAPEPAAAEEHSAGEAPAAEAPASEPAKE